MNNRHPWPLKKSKFWGPFWSYQLNSTANSAHLAQFLRIFSIAIGADYSFDIKSGFSIAPAFFLHKNFGIASVVHASGAFSDLRSVTTIFHIFAYNERICFPLA